MPSVGVENLLLFFTLLEALSTPPVGARREVYPSYSESL